MRFCILRAFISKSLHLCHIENLKVYCIGPKRWFGHPQSTVEKREEKSRPRFLFAEYHPSSDSSVRLFQKPFLLFGSGYVTSRSCLSIDQKDLAFRNRIKVKIPDLQAWEQLAGRNPWTQIGPKNPHRANLWYLRYRGWFRNLANQLMWRISIFISVSYCAYIHINSSMFATQLQ